MEKEIAKKLDENVFIFGTENEQMAEKVEAFVKGAYAEAEVVRLDDKVVGDFLKIKHNQKKEPKQQTIEEYVADESNRALAEEKALLLWNIMTENADVALASKRVFQKSEIVKRTTLTYPQLNELVAMLSMFGLIESQTDAKYEFKFVFTPQVRLSTLYADMLEAVTTLNNTISCYKGAIDATEGIEKDKQKEAIKANIEQLIRF